MSKVTLARLKQLEEYIGITQDVQTAPKDVEFGSDVPKEFIELWQAKYELDQKFKAARDELLGKVE